MSLGRQKLGTDALEITTESVDAPPETILVRRGPVGPPPRALSLRHELRQAFQAARVLLDTIASAASD